MLTNKVTRTEITSEVFLTREAAPYVKLSESTLNKWRLLGEGPPFIRLGHRKIAYLRSDLDSWLTTRRSSSTSA